MLTIHSARIRLELPFESLKVNGGNVVVFLSDEPQDTLVLDSKVLAASSPRFKARFGRFAAMRVSKTVELPDWGPLNIYTYRMIYADGSFIISDEVGILFPCYRSAEADQLQQDKPLEFPPGDHFYLPPLHGSDLCEGIPHPTRYSLGARPHFNRSEPLTVYRNTIKAYKILFSLVHGRRVDLEELEYDAALLHLTDVVALAEYHGFLPVIAVQVRELLVNLPGFWKDVSKSPRFYLIIASKLRSYDIFSDALRHFIGRKGSLKPLHDDESVMSSAKNCKAMFKSLECYSSRAETVVAKLRKMLLHVYQAHTNLPKRSQGPLSYTTWLNTTNSKKTFEDKCEYLAKSAFREWLDFQLVGKTHWSHIQYTRTGRTDGQVEAGYENT